LTPDEARRKAKRILGSIAGGIDPVTPKAETTSAVIEEYLRFAEGRQRPGSFSDTQRYLRHQWRSLHHLPASEVKRRDVAKGLTEIEARHSTTVAARARAALSAMFAWAIREGYEIPSNPVQGTNRPPEPASRERVLTEAELVAIWRACNGSDHGRIVRLLILTGQRRDEIGKLRWNEIDLQGAVIRLPPERTKNKREHILPLSNLAVSYLPAPVVGRDWVFGIGKGFSGYSQAKPTLDQRSGVAEWRLHDLRRTAATMMADKLGVLPHIIEAILNHQSGSKAGVAGIYNRARYLDEMRTALDRWADYVSALPTDGITNYYNK
jgi:integrase